MRINTPVTDAERTFSPTDQLISLTNKKGIITHTNDSFIEVSGFSSEELLGKNHNLVRHPDMPPDAYSDLWQTLKSGKPWMGIVKNRCKNGDYYWVDAYVAPVFENGEIYGYQSVRVRPQQEWVTRATRIYKRIMAGKRPLASRLQLGVRGKCVAGLMALLLSSVVFLAFAGISKVSISTAVLVGTVLSFLIASYLTAPVRKAARAAQEIFSNPLAQQVYTGSSDEVAQIQLTILALQAKLRTVVGRIEESVTELSDLAGRTADSMTHTSQGIQKQQTDTEQLATAMHEMAATVQEVARNTSEAAQAAQRAEQETTNGKSVVSESISAIHSLAEQVEQATVVMHKLRENSEKIGSVLAVISDVAEQTNLLALNAAIEAARAGDSGRGFAVVANEVRNLALRTENSTQEIHKMITNLQTGADEAVEIMSLGHERVQVSTAQAEKLEQSFETIRQRVATITEMNDMVASAAVEQSAVAEEINQNIANISGVAYETATVARQTAESGGKLAKLAQQFQSLIHQCRL